MPCTAQRADTLRNLMQEKRHDVNRAKYSDVARKKRSHQFNYRWCKARLGLKANGIKDSATLFDII